MVQGDWKNKTFKFIKCDIAEFYPSISAELLWKPINFGRNEIEEKITNIIKHARKSLVFH